jgi:hypothetical protein
VNKEPNFADFALGMASGVVSCGIVAVFFAVVTAPDKPDPLEALTKRVDALEQAVMKPTPAEIIPDTVATVLQKWALIFALNTKLTDQQKQAALMRDDFDRVPMMERLRHRKLLSDLTDLIQNDCDQREFQDHLQAAAEKAQ